MFVESKDSHSQLSPQLYETRSSRDKLVTCMPGMYLGFLEGYPCSQSNEQGSTVSNPLWEVWITSDELLDVSSSSCFPRI